MKKPLKITLIILSILIIVLFNFKKTLLYYYGVNSPKNMSPQEIVELGTSYGINPADIYKIDTNYYSDLLKIKVVDTSSRHQQIKNHSQPIQALYFDQSGFLKCFYINCFAGTFVNWNPDHNFDTFLPKQQCDLDTLINFSFIHNYLKPIVNNSVDTNHYDYHVVVFWSYVFGEKSKELMTLVKNNCLINPQLKIKLYWVNNDAVFLNNSNIK